MYVNHKITIMKKLGGIDMGQIRDFIKHSKLIRRIVGPRKAERKHLDDVARIIQLEVELIKKTSVGDLEPSKTIDSETLKKLIVPSINDAGFTPMQDFMAETIADTIVTIAVATVGAVLMAYLNSVTAKDSK